MNGWTGGQYSVFRAAFGTLLAVECLGLAAAGLGATRPLAAAGALAAAALALGWRDRVAAGGLIGVGALSGWLAGPGLPGANAAAGASLLCAHLFLPAAPYGSWDARGRPDPGGGWALPAPVFGALWAALGLLYLASGFAGLERAWAASDATTGLVAFASLLLAFLSVYPRVRRGVWPGMVGLQIIGLVVGEPREAGAALLLLHALAFDPAWLAPRTFVAGAPRVYYDGACGLCHTTVRFLLAEDRRGAIRYAPFASESFASERDLPADLPDSVIVRVGDRLLVRSAGVLALGEACGGLWRGLAVLVGLVPRPLLDFAYDRVAGVRHRLFRRPEGLCPIVPVELRERFLP